MKFLFEQPFDQSLIRERGERTVSEMRIIQSAEMGGDGFRAMLEGFWPYVSEFEKAIDRRALPLVKSLLVKLGTVGTPYIREARDALREMHEEEGSHAAMWWFDMMRLGCVFSRQPLPEVQKLIDVVSTADFLETFALLAATEIIAESLTKQLILRQRFMQTFFPSGEWPWGLAHVIEGPVSHLTIDLDMARGYLSDDHPLHISDAIIEAQIMQHFDTFAAASEAVYVASLHQEARQ